MVRNVFREMSFFYFRYGFRFCRSTADLFTVLCDRISGAFDRSVATHGITPDISKAFVRVWHAFLFHKRKFYGISDEIFALLLFSIIDGFVWFRLRIFLRNIQLKELWNFILCIICVSSLYCLVWIYASLHFLPILLVKLGFRLCVLVFHVSISLVFGFFFSVFWIQCHLKRLNITFKWSVIKNTIQRIAL